MPVDSEHAPQDAHDAHDYELKNAVIVAAIIFSVVLLVGLVGVLQLHI